MSGRCRPGSPGPLADRYGHRGVGARAGLAGRLRRCLAASVISTLVTGAAMPLGPLAVLGGGSVATVSAADAAAQAAREIADAQDRANAAADAYFAALSGLDALQLESEALAGEVAALEAQMGALGARVQAIAVRRFMRAGSNQSSPLLGGFDNAEEQMQLAAFGRVIDDSSEGDLDEYESLQRDLDVKRRALQSTEQALEDEASQAAALRDAALAEVENLRRIEQQRLRDERVRKALELEKRRRAEQAAAARSRSSVRSGGSGGSGGSSPPVYGGSGWVCPTGDAHVAFSDTWGAPRSGGRTHQGVDMIGPRGTPLLAVVGGHARRSSSTLGGLSIWFRGNDGNAYFYAHLDSYGQTGDVAAGTVIGYMGDTGNAQYSTPHLHFEIHPGGGPAINPYPTVRAHC